MVCARTYVCVHQGGTNDDCNNALEVQCVVSLPVSPTMLPIAVFHDAIVSFPAEDVHTFSGAVD